MSAVMRPRSNHLAGVIVRPANPAGLVSTWINKSASGKSVEIELQPTFDRARQHGCGIIPSGSLREHRLH